MSFDVNFFPILFFYLLSLTLSFNQAYEYIDILNILYISLCTAPNLP